MIRLQRVRREHEAFGGHDFGRVGFLGVVDFLEERAFRRLGCRKLVPGFEERHVDLGRRGQQFHVVLFELLDGLGVLLLPVGPPAHERLHDGGLDRFLVLRRQTIPDVLVDGEFADGRALVHARRVVILPHGVQTEPQVFDTADPLRAINRAALGGRQDFAAGHVDDGHAHLRIDFRDDAGLAALHALEVGQILDWPLEPAQRLRARRDDRHGDEVELDFLLVELVPQLEPPGFEHPADEVDGVHTGNSGRRVGEECGRLVLADPPVGDAVGAIDDLLVRGIENFEGRHHGAARHGVDLEIAAGELVDAIDEELEALLRGRRRRHCRLHVEGARLLGQRRCRQSDRQSSHSYDRRLQHMRAVHRLVLPSLAVRRAVLLRLQAV